MSAPRMTEKQYLEYMRRRNGGGMHGKAAKSPLPALRVPKANKMSRPEWNYHKGVLGGDGVYEGETIRITPESCERHEYTPDFVTEVFTCIPVSGSKGLSFVCPTKPVLYKVYHEVKGNYRLQSQDGARLRWCFAAIAHPEAVFVWAKERKDHRWDIEVWFDGGRTRLKERSVLGFVINDGGGVTWRR